MTRKSKKYQLLIITLLLCFLQVAGIDVYAQEPVTPVQKDSTIQSREAPKAQQSLNSSGNRSPETSMIKPLLSVNGHTISFISPSFHNLSLMV